MGKKHKQNKYHQQAQPPAPQPTTAVAKDAGPEALRPQVEALHSELLKGATAGELEHLSSVPVEPGVGLAELLRKAQEAHVLCHARQELVGQETQRLQQETQQLEKARAELEAQRTALASEKAQVSEERQQLTRDKTELDSKRAELRQEKARFQQEQEALLERELDADAGFLKQRGESLRKLDEEIAARHKEIADQQARMASDRARFEKDLSQARTEHEKGLSQARSSFESEMEKARKEQEAVLATERSEHQAALEQERSAMLQELEEERKRLEDESLRLEEIARKQRSTERRLADQSQENAEYKADLDHRVEQRMAARTQALLREQTRLQECLDDAQRECKRLQEQLDQHLEGQRKLGDRTPGEVLSELNSLRMERDQLKAQLASRPGEEAAQRLQALETERGRWESERLRLLDENSKLKSELSRCTIAVNEVERLRDEKTVLETGRDLLQAVIKKLEDDVEKYVHRAGAKSPFPELSKMGSREEYKTRRSSLGEVRDLVQFVDDLQQRIAFHSKNRSEDGRALFYSKRDLRSFVGGMAMSPLHLLQGPSGTGKTSLPLAVADALGATRTLVEVQAGWRDRQDLIGHFNTFEQRFYESEFLKALYQAQCEAFRDVPYFIILDEMNLSHPEQYFADLLSALELRPEDRKLDLMTFSLEGGPPLLKDGRTLRLPRNVWFVGTANHDETTKDFADKTYDRAHVMELPRQRETFDIVPVQSRDPISLESLNKAFAQARGQHEKDARKAHEFLDKELSDFLGKYFGVSWGNRLERQLGDYVPVIRAAGGSLGEAVDHILATKLLRKIRNRHETRPEHLVGLRQRLEDAWKGLGPKVEPRLSLEIIEGELRRLGADTEASA